MTCVEGAAGGAASLWKLLRARNHDTRSRCAQQPAWTVVFGAAPGVRGQCGAAAGGQGPPYEQNPDLRHAARPAARLSAPWVLHQGVREAHCSAHPLMSGAWVCQTGVVVVCLRCSLVSRCCSPCRLDSCNTAGLTDHVGLPLPYWSHWATTISGRFVAMRLVLLRPDAGVQS